MFVMESSGGYTPTSQKILGHHLSPLEKCLETYQTLATISKEDHFMLGPKLESF